MGEIQLQFVPKLISPMYARGLMRNYFFIHHSRIMKPQGPSDDHPETNEAGLLNHEIKQIGHQELNGYLTG